MSELANSHLMASTSHAKPHVAGLVVGTLIGGWHLLWAIVVAVGWGQTLLDFVCWMHFVKPVFVIDAFSIGRAIVLICLTGALGYGFGYLGTAAWNQLHQR